MDYARTHYSGVRLVRSLIDCASAFRRNGDKDLSTALRVEAFDIALHEKAYALAAMAAHQLVISALDEGNIDLAQEWAAKFEQMHRPMTEFWGGRAFILSATHIALCLGDLTTAESLFLPYEDSFLNDPVALCRSSALVAAIRLRIAQGVECEHVAPLVEALRSLHTRFRSMGMYDYESLSLYLGMVYIGKAEEGRGILNEYVQTFRRDRSPYPQQISDILHTTENLY